MLAACSTHLGFALQPQQSSLTLSSEPHSLLLSSICIWRSVNTITKKVLLSQSLLDLYLSRKAALQVWAGRGRHADWNSVAYKQLQIASCSVTISSLLLTRAKFSTSVTLTWPRMLCQSSSARLSGPLTSMQAECFSQQGKQTVCCVVGVGVCTYVLKL